MVDEKINIESKILGTYFSRLCYLWIKCNHCFPDDKYAAEVKKYDTNTSNGVSEKIKTPLPSLAKNSGIVDKNKQNFEFNEKTKKFIFLLDKKTTSNCDVDVSEDSNEHVIVTHRLSSN